MPDAVVVGAGPNGLAAAIHIARAGHSVAVYEANNEIGGGARSAELTLPGFVHDVCSAIQPLAAMSPFFNGAPLDKHGLEWIQPDAPLAHPLDDGSAVLLERSVEQTAAGLGADGAGYRGLVSPLVARWQQLATELLRPVTHLPRHPLLTTRLRLHQSLRARLHLRSRATAARSSRDARAVFLTPIPFNARSR